MTIFSQLFKSKIEIIKFDYQTDDYKKSNFDIFKLNYTSTLKKLNILTCFHSHIFIRFICEGHCVLLESIY